MVQSNIKASTNSVKGNIILEFSDLKSMKIQKNKSSTKYKDMKTSKFLVDLGGRQPPRSPPSR